ncbi:hypothetical protein GUJ93_ZPchr0452g16387 [Zizania palustris]|uniref:Uncharacterized protein n=1 Tax=Zizania palustris TaxID=103762 RepID=A0A8J5R7W2_ZIZPA|nr:hypothetical protein GUJ93_ZPchr0452g16387 [Zizania palustris]
MEIFQAGIIKFEHINCCRLTTDKRTTEYKFEKLLDAFPQAVFKVVWWNVLVEIASAVYSADSGIEKQCLVDALDIGCVTAHPSMLMITWLLKEAKACIHGGHRAQVGFVLPCYDWFMADKYGTCEGLHAIWTIDKQEDQQLDKSLRQIKMRWDHCKLKAAYFCFFATIPINQSIATALCFDNQRGTLQTQASSTCGVEALKVPA